MHPCIHDNMFLISIVAAGGWAGGGPASKPAARGAGPGARRHARQAAGDRKSAFSGARCDQQVDAHSLRTLAPSVHDTHPLLLRTLAPLEHDAHSLSLRTLAPSVHDTHSLPLRTLAPSVHDTHPLLLRTLAPLERGLHGSSYRHSEIACCWFRSRESLCLELQARLGEGEVQCMQLATELDRARRFAWGAHCSVALLRTPRVCLPLGGQRVTVAV